MKDAEEDAGETTALGRRLTASGDVVGVKLRRTEELGKTRTDVDVNASEVSGSRELVKGRTEVDGKASGVSGNRELVKGTGRVDVDVETSVVSGSRELVKGRTEVEADVMTALVCEQGTTVVIVTSRSVVRVFLAVRGQSVTEAGHLVTVSVTVERIVEVVEETRVVVEDSESSLVDAVNTDGAFVGDTTTLLVVA